MQRAYIATIQGMVLSGLVALSSGAGAASDYSDEFDPSPLLVYWALLQSLAVELNAPNAKAGSQSAPQGPQAPAGAPPITAPYRALKELVFTNGSAGGVAWTTNPLPNLCGSQRKLYREFKLFRDRLPDYRKEEKRSELIERFRRYLGGIANQIGVALDENVCGNSNLRSIGISVRNDARSFNSRRWYVLAGDLGDHAAAFELANRMRFGLGGYKSANGAVALYDHVARIHHNRGEFASALTAIEAIQRMAFDKDRKKKVKELGELIASGLLERSTAELSELRVVPVLRTTPKGKPLPIVLSAFSVRDGAPIEFRIVEESPDGTLTMADDNKTVTFKPKAEFTGLTTFFVKVTQTRNEVKVTSQKSPVMVLVEEAPLTLKVKASTEISIPRGQAAVVPLAATRGDGSALPFGKTVTFDRAPGFAAIAGIKVEFHGDRALVELEADVAGDSHPIGVQALSSGVASDAHTIKIIVTEPPADKPTANPIRILAKITERDNTLTIPVAVKPSGNHDLEIKQKPTLGTAIATTGQIRYTPGNRAGLDFFTFVVKTASGVGAPVSAVIEIEGDNLAPKVVNLKAETLLGNPVAVTLNGADPDGTIVDFEVSGGFRGKADRKGRFLIFTPEQTGLAVLKYRAVDDDGARSADGTITAAVTPRPPVTVVLPAPAADDPQGEQPDDPTAVKDNTPINPFAPDKTLLGVFNQRHTADSAWLSRDGYNIDIKSAHGQGSPTLQALASRLDDDEYFDTLTLGYDFTDWFSFGLTLSKHDNWAVSSAPTTIGDTRVQFTRADYDQKVYSLFYHPYRSFYLGYRYLDVTFDLRQNTLDAGGSVTATEQVEVRMTEHLLTIGANLNSQWQWFFGRQDPLDYGKNSFGFFLDASVSIPLTQSKRSPIERVGTLSVGLRFY